MRKKPGERHSLANRPSPLTGEHYESALGRALRRRVLATESTRAQLDEVAAKAAVVLLDLAQDVEVDAKVRVEAAKALVEMAPARSAELAATVQESAARVALAAPIDGDEAAELLRRLREEGHEV